MPGHQNRVGTTKPVQHRNNGQAGERSTAEISAVKPRDTVRLARKHNRKEKAGQKERHGSGQIRIVSRKKFVSADFKRHCATCRTISSTDDDQRCIRHAEPGRHRARRRFRPAGFSADRRTRRLRQGRATRSKSRESKVIKENNGEQSRQRQFKQQRGKTGQREASQQNCFRNFAFFTFEDRRRNDRSHKWNRRRQSSRWRR